MKNLTVNLVDDHSVITDGLQMLLSDDDSIRVGDVAHTGEMALAQLKNASPDIVLLDYSLCGDHHNDCLNGLQTAEKILDEYPEIKIMMLTMHDSAEIIVPCVTRGVHGYMVKSEKNMDLVAAIHHLDTSGFYFSPEIAKDLAVNMRNQNSTEVSEREQEVLNALFTGLSTREIGEKLFISHHTVESHRKKLIQKFNARNSIHLIYLALKKGFLHI